MARVSASVYTSHVPAIGAALDLGKTGEPYWQKVFGGYEFSKQWMKAHKPDVVFLVYNDHANAFSLELIPTFAIGTAAEFAKLVRSLIDNDYMNAEVVRFDGGIRFQPK